MRLRTAMLVGVLALVALIVGVVLFAIQRTVDQGARDEVERELDHSQLAIDPIARALIDRAAVEAHVTAIQPRLLALMATDAATIQDQAEDFRTALGASSLTITDPVGKALGHAGAATAAFAVRGAVEDGSADAITTSPDGKTVFLTHAERLDQGEQVLGVLVVSRAIDQRLASEISEMLGVRAVAVRRDGVVIASNLFSVGDQVANTDHPSEVTDGDHTYRLAYASWPGERRAGGLEVVISANLEDALAPARALSRLIIELGAAGLLLAVVLAIVLGRALSRPVERLVVFSETIAAGKLDARAEVRGVRELRALATAMNDMASGLEAARRTLAEKQRLEDEMKIASRIQTSILPRRFEIARLEIAAAMEPASEVGGDYYDVIPAPGGAWIGIGDVAGHGLDAGLYALMAQTAIAAAVDARPAGAPRELVAAVNRILFANAWGRLGDPRHMTLSLVRFHDDGKVVFAGAHMDLVVVRAAGGVETIATPGTWVGLIDDVAPVTVDGELALAAGDTLVLYSDGVVEAADASGAQFGLERLAAAARGAAGEGPAAVVAGVTQAVAAHRARQDDDVTVMALRYRGPT
jgi:sigma-B regulation protein RsbU (phosphoserine phosphatase)